MLGFTGCTLESYGGYLADPLGTDTPPPDWILSTSWRMTLEALQGFSFPPNPRDLLEDILKTI